MMGQVISMASRKPVPAFKAPIPDSEEGYTLVLPPDLVGRIAEAAQWLPKSAYQMALDTLEEAFPRNIGGAA